MKESHKVTEQEIKALNEVREHSGIAAFTKEQMKNLLKDLHLPISNTFLSLLTKGEKPILIKLKDGTHVFGKTPIHISHLQKIWDMYCVKMIQSSKKRTSSKYGKQFVTDVDLNTKIEKAIELLKSQGFKIQKPIIKYEEV